MQALPKYPTEDWNIEKWTKGYNLPFPKKGDLGITQNYCGITLTAIAAKVYSALLLNQIQPKIEKILWKNQNNFCLNHSTTLLSLTIHWIIKGVRAKNLRVALLFIDFCKAFDSTHWGKMEQILFVYHLPKEIVTATMMLYKNMKTVVCFSDGCTDLLKF